jgi:hypothetical protein
MHKTAVCEQFTFCSNILCVDVVIEQPDMGNPLGDLERLLRAVAE